MAYTPTTWETDDIISAGKLNHLEQGVATQAAGVDALTYAVGDTISGSIWTAATVTNAKADLYFMIPLTRLIPSGCIVTPDTMNIAYRAGGDYHWGGSDYQTSVLNYLTYATVTNSGIAVKISNSGWGNQSTITNNDVASLFVEYSFTVAVAPQT